MMIRSYKPSCGQMLKKNIKMCALFLMILQRKARVCARVHVCVREHSRKALKPTAKNRLFLKLLC